MSDLPRKAVTRTAKLAALPLGFAGRATWGLGKRIGAGRPSWWPGRCSSGRRTSSSRPSGS